MKPKTTHTPARELIERASRATNKLRDAARTGQVIGHFERDNLVMDIHDALNAFAALRDALKAGAAALRSEVEARQWQPIASAPKDGTDVFVSSVCAGAPRPYVFIASYVKFDDDPPVGYRDGWCNHWDGAYLPEDEYELTHWMPLPSPPP